MALHTTDKLVQEIAKIAFPNYSGKKFMVVVQDTVDTTYNAYWSGGTRYWYNFVRLDTMQAFGVVSAQHPVFDKAIENADCVKLVAGLVCVKHVHFCGKDLGITIMVCKENAPKLLPDNTEYTRQEKIVLSSTRANKNTYAGETNRRFKEARRITSITVDEWETAKQNLIEKKLLNKAGAITNAGRNVIQWTRLYELKPG